MVILLAEDQDLVRDSLVPYLTNVEQGAVVVPASSTSEAVKIASTEPDTKLVILDHQLPDMNGLDGLDLARESLGDIPLVLFSPTLDAPLAMRALHRGAAGVIAKSMRGPAALCALRLILSGERYLPSAILAHLPLGQDGANANPPALPPRAIGLPRLTRREHQIFQLLGAGRSTHEIASQLGIATPTVRLHLRQVFHKIGARNRADAVRIGLTNGLLKMRPSVDE